MKILETFGIKPDWIKIKDCIFTVDEVIGIQSSYFYAEAKENLGYYTLAQHEEKYRKKIGELLEEFAFLNGTKEKLTLLELGGGTGKFALYITDYFQNQHINYDYTIVDVTIGQYSEELAKRKGITLQKESFTNFVAKNKKKFDILLMNEALDMWAGEEKILKKWTDENIPVQIFWVLIDLENKELLKKKSLTKIKQGLNTKLIWKKLFIDEKTKEVMEDLPGDYRNVISLPKGLKELIQNIKLFTLVQDYWSFGDQENKLRMGLYEESVGKTIKLITYLPEEIKEKLYQSWQTELEKATMRKAWIESQEVPFGLVDVTYSPNQGQFFELSSELGLDLVNYYAENVNQFDDKIYSVGNQENEVFILFTPYASELQYRKGLQ